MFKKSEPPPKQIGFSFLKKTFFQSPNFKSEKGGDNPVRVCLMVKNRFFLCFFWTSKTVFFLGWSDVFRNGICWNMTDKSGDFLFLRSTLLVGRVKIFHYSSYIWGKFSDFSENFDSFYRHVACLLILFSAFQLQIWTKISKILTTFSNR